MRKITHERLKRLFDEILATTANVHVVERDIDGRTMIDISLPVILESRFTIPLRMLEDETDEETLNFLRYHIMNEAYNTVDRYMRETILKL